MATTKTPSEPRLWHVAFTVGSLERSMEELTAAFGFGWGPLHAGPAELVDDEGLVQRIDIRAVFSQSRPCAVELIEARPGTLLDHDGAGAAFHHIGVWSDNIGAERSRLSASGWPCIGANGQRISLHRGPSGIIVEVCNLLVDRPDLRQFYPTPDE